MKRIVNLCLALAVLVTLASGISSAQQSDSLGDYARSVRKTKKQDATVKTFDNDNLPHNDNLSVVGSPSTPDKVSQDGQSAGNPGDSATDAAKKDNKDADKDKANDEWKDKIAAQKSEVDLLSRELDVLQREYRLRAAAFYADAGNRLRSSADWDKEDTQYKQQIADKQKALDDAKQKLDDVQEEARKAGVPPGMRE